MEMTQRFSLFNIFTAHILIPHQLPSCDFLFQSMNSRPAYSQIC